MTASSVFVANDAAYLLTDTAVMSPHKSGVLWKLAPRVVQSERLKIAVALTGESNVFEWEGGLVSPLGEVGALFEASGNQQEALEAFPHVLENTDRMFSELSNGSCNFRLTIALWSNSGPRGYFLCSKVNCLPGVEPFTLVPLKAEFVYPSVELQVDPERLATDTSEAVAMIEAQRRKRRPEGSCAGHFTIGGEGQLTRVDRHGITTETLVRWPDRIGRKIDPGSRNLGGLLGWAGTWRLPAARSA